MGFEEEFNVFITWVFEHKLADHVSIPTCMFNSPESVKCVGDVKVTNKKTREESLIHVNKTPPSRPPPLVYPCPDRNINCEPCYKPYYK